jgi:diguanylate cyclase
VLATGQANIGNLAKHAIWDRTHLSVVMRIGVLVAVAIACVIIAVLTSAHHADHAALDQERQLFTRAIADHGERVLREMESITNTDRAIRLIRVERNIPWVQQRIDQWLETYFDHEFVFTSMKPTALLTPSLIATGRR